MGRGIWLGFSTLVATLVTIATFAQVVRRLLGVECSFARLLMAGAISLFVGQPSLLGLAGDDLNEQSGPVTVVLIVTLVVIIALVCGMAFLVIAEALVVIFQPPRD
ncbi:MAG TPA: hypothetical protein VNP95_11515 [Thermomicrobiales bacterium]|nr:hypothetical protein [Thermomicrobiales bacterium]